MFYKKIIKTYQEFLIETKKEQIPTHISINNELKSSLNSNGDLIFSTIEGIIKFYEWFGESKMVDDLNRPLVCYHVSPFTFNEFERSRFGKMGEGIYFTSILEDVKLYKKYENYKIYSCYLKIEKLLELENPFSKRNDDNDGILAFKGKNGEEIKVNDPNQIKSVDNDGTFDSNTLNIYS